MQDISLHRITCKRCGHSWIPRKTPVIICPACKRKNWDTAKEDKKHTHVFLEGICSCDELEKY